MKIGKAFVVELGGKDTGEKLENALASNSPLVMAVRDESGDCGGADLLMKNLVKHKFPVTGLLSGRAYGESARLLLACDGIFWCTGGALKYDVTGRSEISLLGKRLGKERARRVLFQTAGKLTKREALASGWAQEVNGTVDEALDRISGRYKGLSMEALSIMRELLYHEDGLTLSGGESLERAAFALVFAGGNPGAWIKRFQAEKTKGK